MQVVERRWEQAAEVVPIPLLWRGARKGGVVEPRLEQAADAYRDVGGRAASGTGGREKSWMDLFRASYIFLGCRARSIRKLNSGPASLNSMIRCPVRAQ